MARTKNIPSTNLTSINNHPSPPAEHDPEALNPEALNPEDALAPPPTAQLPQTGLPAAVNPVTTANPDEVGESSRRPVQTITAPVTWEGVSQMVSTMMDRFLQDLQTRLPQQTPPLPTIEERAPIAPERRIPTRDERGKFVPNGPALQPSPTEVQHNPHQPRQTSSQRCQPEQYPVLLEGDEDEVNKPSYTAMENQDRQHAALAAPCQTVGPFTREVACFPFPPGFRLPHFELYDGSTDPEDHVNSFEIKMQLFNVDDPIMCRAFPSTFKGAARKWCASFAPCSISRFSQLREAFIGHFTTSCTFS
ncbi:hypothetical protein Dimus_038184 [Dionaea muscipula]